MTTLTAPPPTGTRTCPKCGHAADVSVQECPSCYVIIDKAIRAQEEDARAREVESFGAMGQLAAEDRLAVKQQVERLEAWTGIETANAYAINDRMGNAFLHAAEESGSAVDFIVRNFLKAARPFTLRVSSVQGETEFVIKRPFRFFFYEVEVEDPLGRRLGSVKRRFAWLNSIYTVTGRHPGETYEIFGPLFKPWTFKIRKSGRECGLITKRWSGLGREMFTDADNFGIEFPPGLAAPMKAIFLGALFLIDFAHFEDKD